MMRSIAIGLAAATIAIGSSALSASAHHGQKSNISNGSVSRSVKVGNYEEARGRLTPREREHVRRIMREGFAELTPRQREHLRGAIRERLAGLSRQEREHLRGVVRQRLAQLTPRERAYLRGITRERLAESSPRERSDLSRIERLHRHGPYGRR
jgi:FixJ family two-component response regulator